MELLIKHGTIINGDGHTVINNGWVLINKGMISDIGQGNDYPCDIPDVINATGMYIIPGIINSHAHGCSVGPLFSSGALPLSLEKALRNADRHLLQGVTTLINVCGLPLMEEVREVSKYHPMRIKAGTSHFPSTIKAAMMVDGKGLNKLHFEMSASKMLEEGAVVLGEIGSGATLGGGVSTYKYVPEAIENECGIRISPGQAEGLKKASLGHRISKENFNIHEFTMALKEAFLTDKISIEKAREIVDKFVFEPVEVSLQSFDEATEISAVTGIPVVFHNSFFSGEKIINLAQKNINSRARLVAAHCNHPSFSIEESISFAKKMKELGVIIDISSLDSIITNYLTSSEYIDALAGENLIDTISTDYGGGHWDSILEALHYLIKKDLVSPAQGVAMATGNVAGIYSLAAPDRGFIKKGKIADIVLTDDKNIGRVETVIIEGKIVADRGWCLYKK